MNTLQRTEPLSDAERNSSAAQKLLDHLAQEIERARDQLENDLDERKTARLRGELARMRKLVRYLQGRPDIKVSEPPSYTAA